MTNKTNYKQTEIGEIPEDWEIKQLQNVADFSNGYAFSSKSFVNSKYDAVPVFKMGNIGLDGGLKITGKEDYASLVVAEKLKNYLTRENDILMCMTDMKSSMNLLGHSARIHYEKFLVNQRVGIIRPKSNVDASYLYYYLNSPKYIERLRTTARSGVQVNLTTEAIKDSLVLYPTQDEQQQIASTLSFLDYKIELNRKMNKTLEEMGKALFKRWFVDFEFPDENSEPYKSNGGEMVESKWGMIPKWWKAGVLSDEFDILMGQSPPGNTYNEDGNGLPFYQGRTDFGERYPTRRMYCSAPTRIAKPDDTLLSVRAPVGDINQVDEECCIGRGVASISKHEFISYTYYKMLYLKDTFHTYDQEGTVFGSISKKDLSSIEILIPQIEIVNMFESIVSVLDKQIKSNDTQIKNLTETRNLLLPRLMSGKLRVN